MLPVVLAALAVAGPFEKYQEQNETTCVGKADHAFSQPDTWVAAGHKFTVRGARAEVTRQAPPASAVVAAAIDKGGAKLGLLAAVKDFSPETQANLKAFVASFKRAGVSGLVVDGDSAFGVDDQDSTLAELFSFLGAQELPVYVIIGNSESRSSFNRATLAAFRRHPNVINLDLVRRVDGDGFTLVSLPGYFDKHYIHESAGCMYKADDVQDLLQLSREPKGALVAVSHGPPRQEGKAALDVTSDGHNVGDPELASVLAQAKIPFGVFGHILEAGGRATDLSGTPVKAGALSAELYVNPGPAFADPWQLNGGAVSHGMAAILTFTGGKAQWQALTPGSKAKGRALIRVLPRY